MIKTNIFKRITFGLLALAFAVGGTLFFSVAKNGVSDTAQANAKTIINTVDGMSNIRFEPFNVMSSLKIPSTWGGNGAVIPIQYRLTVFSEPNVNEESGVDNSRFTMALSGTYGYFTQNYTAYEYTNKLFLDKSLSDGFDIVHIDQFLDTDSYGDYVLSSNGVNSYGWKSVYGFVPSNVWYQLNFDYDFNNVVLIDTSSSYNSTANAQNQFAVPFIYYLHTTNVNDTGFDWSRVSFMRHTRTAPIHRSYSIGEVEGQDVYQSVSFNCYDIYDFCKTEDIFFRFVFPSYNNNMPFTQEYVYFENLGYDLGYQLGRENGLQQSQQEAWNSGYNTGYELGETKGYKDGFDAKSNSFFDLMSAVVDAPVSVFTGLLNVDIMGVNLSEFALSLLSIALIVAVVRFIL